MHKTTEFKKEEIEGCMEALHLCEAVDLVQVVEDIGWRGVRIDRDRQSGKGKPTGYPVDRGTLIPLGDRECLLWMHGTVKGVAERSYYQGSRSTPRPIRLVRHAGHGPWDETARSALALAKMDWNNDALYDMLPVTMAYAKTLARVVKRMDGLGPPPTNSASSCSRRCPRASNADAQSAVAGGSRLARLSAGGAAAHRCVRLGKGRHWITVPAHLIAV